MKKFRYLLAFGFMIFICLPLSAQLKFGYALRDGGVAVEPNTIYSLCPETRTLVVHPDHLAETMEELGAVLVSPDEWLIDGVIYRVQRAEYVIATGGNGADVATETLPPVRSGAVALVAADAEPVCTTKVKKHVCHPFDCSGCSAGSKFVGGKMSACEHTGVETDTCTLTGSTKKCEITSYENLDCSGAILATSTIEMKTCQ
ncbi:MAG TPA: hypothetical protein VF789_19455 [Thermoanaerobaculia bacterium]